MRRSFLRFRHSAVSRVATSASIVRAAWLVAVVAIAGACTGTGVSAEAYFDSLNVETETYDMALEDLKTEYGQELDTELMTLQEAADFTITSEVDTFFDQAKEVAIVKTADLFSESGTELRAFVDVLSTMEPPEAFIDVHQDLVAAGEALAASMPLTIEAVRSLSAPEDLDETIAASPYNVASQRFTIACQSLEDAAVAAAIDVDIDCPAGPSPVSDG